MRASRSRQAAVNPIIVLVCVLAGIAPALAEQQGEASPDTRPQVTRVHPTPSAHDPAAAFAKRLDLDSQQQAQVRQLLVVRQAQIRSVWINPAIAGSDRVGAVKAINDKTMAQIRALLTEEQRSKYFQPRPVNPATEPKARVEDWLNASTPP
jgi:hypothetical protein